MKSDCLLSPWSLMMLACSGIVLSTANIFAQGVLTPPGAPGLTMKSLDQIESRTAITNTSTLVTIAQPGSYYLTHDITVSTGDAIDITTNGVTLDLNGFTLTSTAASATGNCIYLASTGGNTDITIVNGHILSSVTNNAGTYTGPGFASGIACNVSGKTFNISVSHVSVYGCLSYGIFLPAASSFGSPGYSTLVESCTIKTAGAIGIQADTVTHCTAVDCGNTGISGSSISDSRGDAAGIGSVGLSAVNAENCYGACSSTNLGYGILTILANNCSGYAAGASSYAILANSTAINCYGYCTGTNGNGIYATTASNCRGFSTSGNALNIIGSAVGCYGQSTFGTGVKATVANACVVGGGTTNITYKYNMP